MFGYAAMGKQRLGQSCSWHSSLLKQLTSLSTSEVRILWSSISKLQGLRHVPNLLLPREGWELQQKLPRRFLSVSLPVCCLRFKKKVIQILPLVSFDERDNWEREWGGIRQGQNPRLSLSSSYSSSKLLCIERLKESEHLTNSSDLFLPYLSPRPTNSLLSPIYEVQISLFGWIYANEILALLLEHGIRDEAADCSVRAIVF